MNEGTKKEKQIQTKLRKSSHYSVYWEGEREYTERERARYVLT